MLPMLLILGAVHRGAERRHRHDGGGTGAPVARAAAGQSGLAPGPLTAGKWLTTTVFSLASAWLTLAAFVFMMRYVPLEQLGMQLSLGGQQLLLMAVVCGPMALFASSLQMFVATFARSFKEAQTYVNLLIFVPMIPGMVAQVYPLQSAAWMMLVPALSHQLLLIDVMGGEPVAAAEPGRIGRCHGRVRLGLLRPDGPHAAPGADRLRSGGRAPPRPGAPASRDRGPLGAAHRWSGWTSLAASGQAKTGTRSSSGHSATCRPSAGRRAPSPTPKAACWCWASRTRGRSLASRRTRSACRSA